MGHVTLMGHSSKLTSCIVRTVDGVNMGIPWQLDPKITSATSVLNFDTVCIGPLKRRLIAVHFGHCGSPL